MKSADVVVGMAVVANGVPGEVVSNSRGWVTVTSEDGEAKYRAADIEPMEEQPSGKESMAQHLRKYRQRYQTVKSYSGSASANNGDPVAKLLQGMTPKQVMEAADELLGEAKGTHEARYSHLNLGQQRMNAGNRIRGAIKRGELVVDEESGAIDKVEA